MPPRKKKINYEKKIIRNHDPINLEQMKLIKKQLKKYVCKIILPKERATGFFCEINYKNQLLPVLITSNHVINEEMLKNRITINLTLNDDKIEKEIKFRYKRRVYTNINYDITIIEILPKKDEINDFLKFDEKQCYKGESIYILQYPDGKKASVSYGAIENLEMNGYEFTHLCSTSQGSSGSPILNLEINKVIGIHNKAYKNLNGIVKDYNGGIFMKEAINQFQEGINSFVISDNTHCFINLIKSSSINLVIYSTKNNTFPIGVEEYSKYKTKKKGVDSDEIYLEKEEDKEKKKKEKKNLKAQEKILKEKSKKEQKK